MSPTVRMTWTHSAQTYPNFAALGEGKKGPGEKHRPAVLGQAIFDQPPSARHLILLGG